MPKFTNTDYTLPYVHALIGERVLGSGTTQPMLIQGICSKTAVKSDYVVKFINAPRMTVNSSCSELIASFIGMELDLNIAEPAIINITTEFVETLLGKDGYKHASNSLGLNFGCKYVPGFMELASRQQLTDNLYEQAEQIFSFDIFISNVDRRIDKPNMLTDGEKILIFDHELAFGFVFDIIKNPTPWIISEHDTGWIKNHYFYQLLKENENHFHEFVDTFEIINEGFWEKAYINIPDEWKNEHFQKIRSNLDSLIKNKEQFKEELNKILS